MDIEARVKNVISDICQVDEVEKSSVLRGELGLDSLSMILLLVELENVFNIQIKEEDLNPLEIVTVENVIYLVEKYVLWEE